jgi:hypothetical protein
MTAILLEREKAKSATGEPTKAATMNGTDDTERKRQRGPAFIVSVLRQIYIQFAAVTGALSLAALLSHILVWQGVLLDMVEWWTTTVRPVVDFIYAPLVALLERILHIDVAIPIVLKDYLAVGLVLILSRWRGATGGWKGGAGQAVGNVRRRPFTALGLLLKTLFIWPFELVVLAQNMIFARRRFPDRSSEDLLQIRISHMIALLPVFYAIALVLLNWLLALVPTLLTRPDRKI